jgi:transposase-like protein
MGMVCSRLGSAGCGKPLSEDEVRYMVRRYYDEQAFLWQIARETGRSLSAVRRTIRHHGEAR